MGRVLFVIPEECIVFSVDGRQEDIKAYNENNLFQHSPSGEFPEDEIDYFTSRGQHVNKVDVLSLVHGARRTNNFIIGVKDPRSVDAAGATIL